MAPKKAPIAKKGNSRKAIPPPPTAGSRTGSHRTGPWVGLDVDFTDTLIVCDPSPTEVANAAPAATLAAATPTVTFDPDLYVINTPLASRSSSRQPSPFTRSPLLRGLGHLDERYDFHRIVKARKDETSAITPPSASTTPIVNLPEGVTEEMMMEDIRAAKGIRVRAQERRAGPPAVDAAAASSTEGLTQAQLEEHEGSRRSPSRSLQRTRHRRAGTTT